ncbi:MAG: hypothetical protein ACI4WG_02955 [Erysipelotrichaceae bacterium]
MCTSIVSNINKTIVGFNLDLLEMQHQVVCEDDKVTVSVFDKEQGWLPLFGGNNRGDFITMPTCWPFDARSNPVDENCYDIIHLDIDLLLKKRTFEQTKEIVATNPIYSVSGVTFQAQLSDGQGNVLQIIPGQGYRYFSKPKYAVMTNFSPIKGDSQTHPWMGLDRYQKAEEILAKADHFDVVDCFELLKQTAQIVCPTVVSIVFDVEAKTIYYCQDRQFDKIEKKILR